MIVTIESKRRARDDRETVFLCYNEVLFYALVI